MSSTDQSGFRALVQFAAISLLSLVAAPALVGTPLSPLGRVVSALTAYDVAWLKVTLLLMIWLIAIMPALARALAESLFVRLPVQTSRARESALRLDASRFARWSVVTLCYIVAQAALRRPLSSVLATQLSVSSPEPIVAAGALLLLLFVFWRLYSAVRPIIEASARNLLDTLLSAEVSLVQTDTARSTYGATGAVAVSTAGTLSDVGGRTAGPAGGPSGTGDTTTGDTTYDERPQTDQTAATSTGETTRFDVASATLPPPEVSDAHGESKTTTEGGQTLWPAENEGITVLGDESTRTVG